ncbi:hypothetical protein [Candidatus Poriferisodalis sp.]|uniref:hypothetical protein n=1 Tax=Candidatus Poriferisodalis sp. TaxID=3101277 RepID=UPI003B0266B9
MPMIWWLPVSALGLLAVVSVVLIRRLTAELRAATRRAASVADAASAVHADVVRTRAAIDSLELPSVRRVAAHRALGWATRWAVRRMLP